MSPVNASAPGSGIVATHRRLLLPVFAPSALAAFAQQSLGVLLPLYFLDVGMSAGVAAAVFGLRGLGMVLADVPAGFAVARLGDRRAIAGGLAGLGAAALAAALTVRTPLLGALMLLYGTSLSVYLLGRLSLVSDTVVREQRGRVLSVIAGIMRLGALAGPVAAGLAAEALGFATTFAALAVLLFTAALIVLVRAPEIGGFSPHTGPSLARIRALVGANHRVFATAGTCALVLMLMRATRTVIVPLIGASLGVGVGTIGVLVSISAAVDLLLFYPAGEAMDRFGRRVTLVPGMALMGISFAGLSLVESLAGLASAAFALGVANGWTTGVVMTIGTDLAPRDGRREFLGVWRLWADTGSMLGPFLVAALIGGAGLPGAAAAVGAIGLAGAALALRAVPDTARSE